jgi:hypothetical protein
VTVALLAESRILIVLLKKKIIYLDIQNTKNNTADKDNNNSNNSSCRIVFSRNIIQGSRFGLINNINSPLSNTESIILVISLERRFARPKKTPSIYNEIEFVDNIFSISDT